MKNLINHSLAMLFFVNFGFGQIINFPDLNLKTILSLSNSTTYKFAKNISDQWMQIDTNGDGEIQLSEALLVKAINFKNGNISTGGSWTVHNITGLESFTNLEYLSTAYNNFNSSVDFSALVGLKELQLFNCGINSINVSGLNLLEIFGCQGNNLTNLDVSELSNLFLLYCGVNQIQELNVDNNPLLTIVGCSYNLITSLDFSNNPLLTKLACSNNHLTGLNIKNGVNHNFVTAAINDCWKIGNPNLTNVCVDASEQVAVQNFLDGCGTAQIITATSSCALVNEGFSIKKTILYPNPTKDKVTINFNNNSNKIELYDFQGRLLIKKTLSSNQEILDISNYANGVYFIKVENDNLNEIIKILKK